MDRPGAWNQVNLGSRPGSPMDQIGDQPSPSAHRANDSIYFPGLLGGVNVEHSPWCPVRSDKYELL